MRKLTYEEFQMRLRELDRARHIFSNLTDNNITKAFEAYQEILMEDKMPVGIPAESVRGMTGSVFDSLPRPKCPICGMSMYIRGVPPNKDHIQSQLVCVEPKCDTVLDSELSVYDWRDLLSKLKEEGYSES